MRILVVSCVYPPEPVVSSKTSSDLAMGLAENGHEVTVITAFPSRPAGKIYPGYRRTLYQWAGSGSGYKILRCFSTLSSESRLLSRLLENLTFGVTSSWKILTSPKPDVIYANTWPIVATGILFLVSKLRRIPLVISVQDVYPEVLVAQQRIAAQSLITRMMHWIDGVISRNSAQIIVISERFAEIYQESRRVPSDRLNVVPNWIDSNHIDITVSKERYRQRQRISKNNFLLVYGGNVGMAAGVEIVIEAMRLLDDEPELKLLIAGSGSQLANCQRIAQSIPGLPVLFHSPWAHEETSEVLRAADLLVLPTQYLQSLTSVPSKLLSYMLSCRPVLATAVPESDLAELVNRAQCGWVIEPNRPDLLAAQIRDIRKLDPTERQRRGDNGRAYVLQHFSKYVCLPKAIHILEAARR